MNKPARLLSLMMLCAAIAGCGGGGGGSPAPAPPPPVPGPPAPPAAPAPPAPTQETTGLGPPTLSLNASTNPIDLGLISSLVFLAQEMVDAEVVADAAAAAQAVARVSVNATPFNCPGGGTMTAAAPGSLTYTNCGTAAGYAFNGNATLTTNATGYTLSYNGLAATGANAPVDPLTGSSVCTTAGGPNCVTTLGSFRWGFDATYANGVANGTHQCTCVNNQTWNVVFRDFGPTSGVAYVYATNGIATATRTGDKSFTVTQTVNGVVTGPVPFTLP